MPSRVESTLRRSSTGQSQTDSSTPTDAFEPAKEPSSAAFTSLVRPCSRTCSTLVVIAWWKEPPPSLDDFFVRPGCGDFWVEAHERVEVIIHDGEPADGDCEDTRKFFEATFDPFLAVERFLAAVERDFAQRECAADTAGDSVIPARNRYIDKMGASHRHGRVCLSGLQDLPRAPAGVKIAMGVLFLTVSHVSLSCFSLFLLGIEPVNGERSVMCPRIRWREIREVSPKSGVRASWRKEMRVLAFTPRSLSSFRRKNQSARPERSCRRRYEAAIGTNATPSSIKTDEEGSGTPRLPL